jgi:hypothetical protein
LNIGIITSSFPANSRDARAAAGLFVKDFALTLCQTGHRVRVIAPDKAAAKETIPGIEVHWFNWLGGKKRLSYMNPFNPI